MNLLERMADGIFIMDGAMGTQLQARGIPPTAWQGKEGCNEILNLTAPDVVRSVHAAYLEAGCDAVETNSFGASPLTLGEYGLADQAFAISRAAAQRAREACAPYRDSARPRFVFGSVGPGTKLPTLGQVAFDPLCAALATQIGGLVEGGADAILLETCQDVLQIKAGILAFEQAVGFGRGIPLYVSVTVEQTGTLLIGASLPAVVAILEPFPVDILGLNCATGPDAMRRHVDYLARHWPRLIACMPNAGLPILRAGGATYPLGPDEFAARLGGMARATGLNIVGGCCGTSPDHIRALAGSLAGWRPPARTAQPLEQASSVFGPVDLTQAPPPLYIGERANATGSKKFRDALLAGDYEAAFAILGEQEEAGAHLVDLSCAYAGRDELRDIQVLVPRAGRECRLPLMLDSLQPAVVEAALKLYGGRMFINSINFESGEARADLLARLARRHGAGLVGLCIDEQGMAMTAERKLDVARRLAAFCEARGLRRADLLIDPLTFTLGSGDDSLRASAGETLAALVAIRRELPGVRSMLGLSNVSFGLKPAARQVLNAVFLDRCLKAGLDACIINVAAIAPLPDLPPAAVAAASALLDNDAAQGDPLARFINLFEAAGAAEAAGPAVALEPAEALARAVIRGKPAALPELVPALLASRPAEDILNLLLVPAMKEVGRLFNEGQLQLPFVLKSAEVMKKAVDLLKPHLRKDGSGGRRGTMVLATVAGDVHDIGKNLVDIILANNGFHVVNLGTKIPVEQMIAAVREHQADVLGMSGLLVKSTAIMAENLGALQAAGVRVPVFLGGAALTAEFVATGCQPGYAAPVVYCRDAFEGLARMRELMDSGTLPRATPPAPMPAAASAPAAAAVEIRAVAPPAPPFWGPRIVRDIKLADVFPLLNETALVRGRWGFRRGQLAAEDYRQVLETEVRPRLERMKIESIRDRRFAPQAAYGYFHCRAAGDLLYIEPAPGAPEIALRFPRQRQAPRRAIPDFFRADGDVAGFMVVTLGPALADDNAQRLKADHYQDYLLWHGLAVELTDALAEFWHLRMRQELGLAEPALDLQGYITQRYQGSRYGFGYPACPDLAMNRVACDLVQAAEIGVTLTENFMMTPEMSTAALVAHHPQAKYFNVD